jgi:hypothetical protein
MKLYLIKSGMSKILAISIALIVVVSSLGVGFLVMNQQNSTSIPSLSPTQSQPITPKPSSTLTQTDAPTLKSATHTPGFTVNPTATPTATPNPTATPTATPNPTATPTATPTPTPRDFPGYTSYNTFTAVEDACKAYLQVKATGSSSSGLQLTEYGNVTWIGSANDATKLFSNVHLVMYTRLDSTTTPHFPVTKIIEIHVSAYITNSPTIPSDIIDKTEVVIPKIGLDNPQYNFSLTCIGWA